MRWLILLAALTAAVPTFAYGDSARAPGSIQAYDFGFENPATGDSDVTVDAGETVTFSYPTGSNFHSVVFSGGDPAECTPPLPEFPKGAGWSASCRFDTPGTYAFVCGAHANMTGTVVVQGSGTPTATPTGSPTATPTAIATATATTTATATAPTPTSTPAPTAVASANTAPPTVLQTPTAPAASGLKIAAVQRGQAVRGSLTLTRAGSKLKVDVLAKPAALGRKGKAPIRVGGTAKPTTAGSASFSITLNAAAKKVIKRRGKLALTVTITVTPASGAPFTATKTVTLKR
jgi:plastocyanin